PRLDRVHLRSRDQLGRLVPGGPDEAPLATRCLITTPAFGIAHYLCPRSNWVPEPVASLAVHLKEHAAYIWEAHPRRRVRVPGERRPPRATTWLVLRRVGAYRRVGGLLGLPCD